MMMNRLNSNEPYSPFTMSIYGVEEENQQKEQVWHWEGNAQTSTSTSFPNQTMINTQHNSLQFNTFPDCNPPPLPPLNSLQLYSPLPQPPVAAEYYHAGLLKPVLEERVGHNCNSSLNIGLNLSQNAYFSSGEPVSFNRLFWRSRGGYFFAHQPPRCQAEGCKADLSNAKRYHRRHKVCEFHSKASIVIVAGGLRQRFCQQCSRFHSLDAFDDTKKSCRKRLADHNRRRRKPQPPSSDNSSQAPITAKKRSPASKTISDTKTISTCKVSAPSTKDLDRQNDHNSQATNLRIGSSLSLGGLGTKKPCMNSQDQFNYQEALDAFSEESSEHQLQQQLSSSSSSNFHLQQQNLAYSSSKDLMQSTGGGSDLLHPHQSSLLHLRQAMFDLDYV